MEKTNRNIKCRLISSSIPNRPTNVYLLSQVFRKREPLNPMELYNFVGEEEYDEYDYPEEIIQYSLTDVGYDASKPKTAWFDLISNEVIWEYQNESYEDTNFEQEQEETINEHNAESVASELMVTKKVY
ncbi:MAG: hypothetical protein ACRC4L_02955 [Mycoplasma sp.]